jgi:hypothetical protein
MISEKEIVDLYLEIKEQFFNPNEFHKICELARRNMQPCSLLLIDMEKVKPEESVSNILAKKNLKQIIKIYNHYPYIGHQKLIVLGSKIQTGQQKMPATVPIPK